VHRGLPESGETVERQATHVKARKNATELKGLRTVWDRTFGPGYFSR
jgi:hypothetical protein